MRRLTAIATLASLLIAAPAAAQDWEPGPNGTCPPPAPAGEAPRESWQVTPDDVNRAAWSRGLQVVWPEVALYDSSSRIRPIMGPLIRFGEQVEILARSERDPDTLLARDRVRDRCGWLQVRDLMSLSEALDVVELPGYEASTGIDNATPLRLKAKIVVRASRDPSDGRILQVPLYTAPNALEGYFRGNVDYFAVADVFRAEREGGGRCGNIQDPDCFLLIGGTDVQDGVTVPRILGWVRGTDVELWPSSMSLYFGDGRTDVPVFLELCHAMVAGTGRRCGPGATDPIAAGSWRDHPSQNFPRFPVIRPYVGREEGLSEDVWVYQIVTALEICAADGSGECRSAERFIDEQGRIGQGLKLLQTADILFVIDGSESMERYFRSVVDAAVGFSEALAGSGITARFGAVVYSDYQGALGIPDAVSMATIAEFGDPGDAGNLRALTDFADVQRRVTDEHRDLPEAPFAALARAIEPGYLDWSPEAGLRIVIWIGDIGNRDRGEQATRGPGGTLTEAMDARAVADAVMAALPPEARAAILLGAINVPGRGGDAAREDFLRDYAEVSGILGAEYLPQLPALSVTTSGSDAAEVTETRVREALEDLVDIVRTTEFIAAEGDVGAAAEAAGEDAGLPTFRISGAVAERLGLLPADGEGAIGQGEVLAVESYYVRQDLREGPGTADFDYWLGLRLEEIIDLSNAMTAFCDKLETFNFADELNTAYAGVLEAVTRDQLPESLTPAEFLERTLSVPKSEFSDFLNQPAYQWFEALVGNAEALRAFRERICIKAQLVNYVRQGKRTDPANLVMEGGRVVLREGAVLEDFAWDWIPAGGIRYFFFPLEFLP